MRTIYSIYRDVLRKEETSRLFENIWRIVKFASYLEERQIFRTKEVGENRRFTYNAILLMFFGNTIINLTMRKNTYLHKCIRTNYGGFLNIFEDCPSFSSWITINENYIPLKLYVSFYQILL